MPEEPDRPDPLELLDDKLPGKGKRTSGSLRSLVALLVAIGGVIGALTALLRAFDESVTKESYKTLVGGIGDVQNKCEQEHAQDREEIVAMRSYLDGFINGRSASLVLPSPSPSPSPRLTLPTTVPKSATDAGAAGAASPAATIFVAPPPPAAPAAPPAAPWKAPDFDTVQRKARAD